MWNRSEEEQPQSQARPAGAPKPGGARATLGPSIAIQGKLAGKEDLWVEGRFEGEIRVPGHQVTIGRQGSVQAEIRARLIVVEGTLSGNIVAEEQAVVRATGRVDGDIKAPKVALDEGCQFKGRIDMEPGEGKSVDKRAQDADPKPTVPASPGQGQHGEGKVSSAAPSGQGSLDESRGGSPGEAAGSRKDDAERPGTSPPDRKEGSRDADRKRA